MREWSEQEEQEMIERAKAGEPEANYELSLWALARSEEEPDEPRWNRLAAKCLVKSAQAGYGPAQKRMAALLKESETPSAGTQEPAEQPKRRPAPKAPAAREPVSIHEARGAAGKAPTSTARRPGSRQPAERPAADEEEEDYEESPAASDRHAPPARRQAAPVRRSALRPKEPAGEELYDSEDYDEPPADNDDWDETDEGRPARGGKSPNGKKRGNPFSNWGDAQWRRLELICVAICVVLLVAIAIMLFTSRRGAGTDNGSSAIPPAGEAATAAATDTPAPADEYPDADTRAAIEAAELDIPPMEEDYRDGPTTATVSVNSISLRLRKGPNTSYSEITSMPDGSKVEVFADKNDWSLVRYQADDGPVYGWCSSTYLIIDATPAAIG